MTICLSSDQFGKNMRRLRLKQKLSQKALAEKCGVSVYRIRMTESGRIRQLEDVYFASLCDALKVTNDEFFSTAE